MNYLLDTNILIYHTSGIPFKHDFLKRKLDEYEMLKMEIEELKKDLGTFPIPKGEGKGEGAD